jgi:hypothetical protein
LRGEARRKKRMRGRGKEFRRFRSSGDSGVQEFRSSGVQEFRSSGVQEFRSSGVQAGADEKIARYFQSKSVRMILELFRATAFAQATRRRDTSSRTGSNAVQSP